VSSVAEDHVLLAYARQFGYSQARLDGEQKKGAVTPTDPSCGIGSVKQSIDLMLVEEFHEAMLEPFARDRKHPLTMESVGRFRQCDVTEEGMNRC